MVSMIRRFGKLIPADEVFFAWTSNDLDQMRAAIRLPTNPIDRHHLLQCLVSALYRRRGEPGVREEMLKVADMHLEEMKFLMHELKRDDAVRKAMSQARRVKRGDPVSPRG